MLSEREYQDLLWKLDHIPATITGKKRQNLKTTFKKKLHEHQLATHYPAFQPLKFEKVFINFQTSDSTLRHLIEQVDNSTIFTLDTESTLIPYQPNKPALIQVQIISSKSFSYVVLIEVCHLPSTREPTFKLIQQFFKKLFDAGKNIFIWGEINELYDFVKFNLFTYDQIHSSNNINLQDEFKTDWNKHHPHQSTTSSSMNYSKCQCEECLGLQANNTWSLQNAVAFALNQWLDKRQTKSSFGIGLDPKLYHYNSDEINHRESLSQYAAYDCLSMQQLIIYLNMIEHNESTNNSPNELTNNSSDEIIITSPNDINLIPSNVSTSILINNDNENDLPSLENDQRLSTEIQIYPTNELETISSDDETPNAQQQNTLNAEQRRKIHNRSCTLKQRKKLYKYEFIRRGIDPRFTIKQIKQILRQHNIHFCALNASTSSLTHRRSLYIGIKDKKLLAEYEHKTRTWFTTNHYNTLYLHHSKPDNDKHHSKNYR